MPRLFIGNFDFERQLAGATTPSRSLTRLNAELACCWLAVADAGDCILAPEPIPEAFLSEMAARGIPPVHFVATLDEARRHQIGEVIPWGWTAPIQRWATANGSNPKALSPEAVAEVNSRRFSAQLEDELNCELPGSGPAGSTEELHRRIADLTQQGITRWVLKGNYTQAGRERLRGEGSEPGGQALRWCHARWRRDGVVFVEPLVESVAEVGLQWTIPRQGDPVLDAVVPLLCCEDGSYRASQVLPPGSSLTEWEPVLPVQQRAVRMIQQRGYFGPVGIDAMRCRLAGEILLRPLQDINARWTMGRLAVGWGARLSPGLGGAWFHGPHPPAPHAIATSPQELGEQPVQHCTWWVEQAGLRLTGK